MPTDPGRRRLTPAERIAALIDGRLTSAERDELIRILAASGTDRELLAGVVRCLEPDRWGLSSGGGL